MKEELFQELLTSVREGGKIMRGEIPPSRKFVINGPDIKHIRENYGLSQNKFAAMLGISVATLQNWEQGRRSPEGPARILLQVAAKHPDAVWDVVKPTMETRPAKSATTRRVASSANGKKRVRT